jgi:glycerol uptake facilitator-like aquaporin
VVGSGIAAQRLSPDDVGLQLLENSIATAAGLVALIAAFGSVSGAHFNPVVSLVDRFFGGLTSRELAAYVSGQIVGACIGAVVANLMFDLAAMNISHHERGTSGHFVAEVVATFGLVLVILGVARNGRPSMAPVAVAGYIGAAYWFTSSTSFANPAVTIGRTLSDSFAGIAPSSVPAFIAAQVIGGVGAAALALFVYRDVAVLDVVVPHEHELRDPPIPKGSP